MKGEIYKRKEFVSSLRDTTNSAAHHIFNNLHTNVKQLIIEGETYSSISDSVVRIIRQDMNQLIRSDKLIVTSDIIANLHLPSRISEQINANPSTKDIAQINRSLVDRIFYGQIVESPFPTMHYMYNVILPYDLNSPFTILIYLFLCFTSGYNLAHSTVRVTFIRMNHIDNVLEYFTEEMGFKPPFKKKGYLIFKPTTKKIVKEIFTGIPSKIKTLEMETL